MVRFVAWPLQMEALPEIAAVGSGVTVTMAVPEVLVPVQLASLTVGGKVYVVVADGEMLMTAGDTGVLKGPAGLPLTR